jgi:hypothetical protein
MQWLAPPDTAQSGQCSSSPEDNPYQGAEAYILSVSERRVNASWECAMWTITSKSVDSKPHYVLFPALYSAHGSLGQFCG